MLLEVDPEVEDYIQSHRVARLATVDPEARPTVVPLCYAFDSGRFYSAIDDKPKSVSWGRLKRLRNIEDNARVSLLIDDYSEDWTRLSYLLAQGQATLLEPNGRFAVEHENAVALLCAKYPQYAAARTSIDRRPVIRISVERLKFWSAAATNRQA